ncbi:alpha/beta fold hydrolase [Massilia sp. GCM10023247]|uniref:alpha/beta fold hydrolase n=1 Tax=Massilia sp. GCM10023247 TaxID=3252643 RepID=UPI003621F53B
MSGFAHLDLAGRPLRLEYQWVGVPDSPRPTVVFLHEGLGSVALWKDFPERFCRAGGFRGLVYSRNGYGRSTPRPHEERWPVDFMHRQAWEVLPALLAELGIERPWLFGHSDGGSIALLHAARFPVSGLVVAAPHIMVEDLSVDSIAKARTAYLEGGLRERLARYHDDIDSAFWGWNDIWLDPAFRAWDIREHLPAITVPLLAIQGTDDEYGTLEQIHGIARLAPQTRLLVLPECGHSPHRDQAGRLIDEATRFMISPN